MLKDAGPTINEQFFISTKHNFDVLKQQETQIAHTQATKKNEELDFAIEEEKNENENQMESPTNKLLLYFDIDMTPTREENQDKANQDNLLLKDGTTGLDK